MLDAEWDEKMPGTELDRLLAKGWYRMGLSVFTSDFIDFNEKYYRTIWLRYDLTEPIFGKTWRKLLGRNKGFRLVFSEATHTEEQAYLFRIYRNAMSFEPAHSIEHLLFDGFDDSFNPFQTMQVCVFDKEKLIGCSYFDLGETSVAGISSFYDPAYQSCSLGIFLIYCQMLYVQQRGFLFYYPGYFIPHYSHFDYKLRIAKQAQYFYHPKEKKWMSMQFWEDIPLPVPLR